MIIESDNRAIALVGSITNVKSAIAEVGSPMPRNPFTVPADRKIKNKMVNNQMFSIKI